MPHRKNTKDCPATTERSCPPASTGKPSFWWKGEGALAPGASLAALMRESDAMIAALTAPPRVTK
jgi:hypothetical protein